MKTIITIMLLSLVSLNSLGNISEDTIKINKNSFLVEFGGKGLGYSLNYDRTFFLSENHGAEIGIGYTRIHASGRLSIDFNMLMPEIDFFIGKTHKMEFGYSRMILLNGEDKAFDSIRIGFRYCNAEGGFVFRASYFLMNTHGALNVNNSSIFNWFGLSFGFTF